MVCRRLCPESSGTISPLNSPSSTSVWRNPAGLVSDDEWLAGMVSVTGAARTSRCVPGGQPKLDGAVL